MAVALKGKNLSGNMKRETSSAQTLKFTSIITKCFGNLSSSLIGRYESANQIAQNKLLQLFFATAVNLTFDNKDKLQNVIGLIKKTILKLV